MSHSMTNAKANHNIDETPLQIFVSDISQGNLKQTSGPLDMAISGEGYFLVRQGDEYLLTRAGKFSRGPDGLLQNAEGLILQFAGGADAAAESDAIEILTDGTLLDGGTPAGKIGVYASPSGNAKGRTGGMLSVASPPEEMDDSAFEIRQGMLESSNVVLSDEMVALMANTRQAEGAAQLVRLYDQLVGQAITTFARAGR